MNSETESELKTLLNKTEIGAPEAEIFLRKVSEICIKERDEYLRKKDLANAKKAHDELAKIYLKLADKVSDEKIKKSLVSFADYWLRSGETEIFIEPSNQAEMPSINAQILSLHKEANDSFNPNLDIYTLYLALGKTYGAASSRKLIQSVPAVLDKISDIPSKDQNITFNRDEAKILKAIISNPESLQEKPRKTRINMPELIGSSTKIPHMINPMTNAVTRQRSGIGKRCVVGPSRIGDPIKIESILGKTESRTTIYAGKCIVEGRGRTLEISQKRANSKLCAKAGR
jgi:hypothetical protein